MKLTDFNVLTSCPKDELHQWFLGLYGEHIIPVMVHSYTQVLRIGVLYPFLRAMMNRADLHLYYSVRLYLNEFSIMCYVYVVHIHRCCDWPLQQFRQGHSAQPDFLQPLWGTSLKGCWSNGIERNSQGIRALACPRSLRREGWGPPRQSSTHSMLSGRKCNLNYST